MHDLSYFRNNFDRIAERLATRGPTPQLDQFRELDQKRRTAIFQSEKLKERGNSTSTEIQRLKREGADTTELQKQGRALRDEIASLDEQVKALEEPFRELLAGIPNIPHESVPVGKTEADNVEVRRCGQPPRFDFDPKAHWDLGPELGILDLERTSINLMLRCCPSLWIPRAGSEGATSSMALAWIRPRSESNDSSGRTIMDFACRPYTWHREVRIA